MADTHSYVTRLEWKDTRRALESPPGLPSLEVATPPEFPGGIPGIWSPEHLFVASAEACLMTTFLAIAENSKLEFRAYRSEAEGTLEKTDAGFVITRIVLRPTIVVGEEAAVDRAKRIIEKAEKHCLISNSMKSEVHLQATVTVG